MTKAATTQKTLMGHFPAKLAWVLEPIAEYAQDDLRFWDGSLFMEPAPDGGAFVGAISGHVMAIFHSFDAWCNAPMTFRVPLAAFRAAEFPQPVPFNYCGVDHPVDVPEWMQPGTFWVTSAGMFILPKMRAPCFADEEDEFQPVLFQRTASVGAHEVGIDYLAKEGVSIDWRRPLVNASTATPDPAFRCFAANPFIVSRLERVFDLALAESPLDKPPAFFHRPTGTEEKPGPILITITGRPDIVATYMPMTAMGEAAPAVPWSFLKSPSKQDAEAGNAA